jgi:hypothetical protein
LNPTIRDQDFLRIFSPEGILINDVYPDYQAVCLPKQIRRFVAWNELLLKSAYLKHIDTEIIFLSSFASFVSFYFSIF